MSKTDQNKTEYDIEINKASMHWNLEKGSFDFFGLPSALFWINPSLSKMLLPLAEEIGFDLYRMLVAHSSSKGAKEDYHSMVTALGDNFTEGFLAWGKAVSTAGWGTFEVPLFDIDRKTAIVSVRNTWELIMQQESEQTFGCPFLFGKIIGIFSHALGGNCWADEKIDWADLAVKFQIYPSEKTISDELRKLRSQKMRTSEKALQLEVTRKTSELEEALREARNAREDLKKELSKQEETRRLREKMERWEKYIIFTLADEEYCIKGCRKNKCTTMIIPLSL